jgi:hypothetical protein
VAIITGSTTSHAGWRLRSSRATSRTIAALPSMPVFTAPMAKSSNTASSWLRICASGTGCTALTPRVFCEVMAAMAERPCTPRA